MSDSWGNPTPPNPTGFFPWGELLIGVIMVEGENGGIAPLGSRPCAVSIIDAGFFYHVRKKFISDTKWKPEHLERFADLIVPKYHWRFRTYFVDGYPANNPRNPSGSTQKRREKDEYFRGIERLERFSAIRGECRYTLKKGFGEFSTFPKGADTDPFKDHLIKIRAIEQKQVDVLLASEISRIAYSGESKHITLITGDQDFIPVVKIAKNAGVIIRLLYYRSGGSFTSTLLMDAADERKDMNEIFEKIKTEFSL